MRALTVQPGQLNSISLDDFPEPPLGDGNVLVRALAFGICGTDREIISGKYGWPPPGKDRLILGHESLGRVRKRRPVAASCVAIWLSASCGGPTPCRARPAPQASGICAATGNTPNAASSNVTDIAANIFALKRIS